MLSPRVGGGEGGTAPSDVDENVLMSNIHFCSVFSSFFVIYCSCYELKEVLNVRLIEHLGFAIPCYPS